ncbi:RagB/SusD family nutrient uptake outer membrane protein [Aestuariibaculum suncheonense]|uniref:RagB/SusD family nutrient uptake outer membrane protein n=1 Tax=Aestuariibaculum suncheonense TaxID=1028745 RepID=A0A8J6Q9A4_9FLAO|nr:RagB/SusD family nutrient uptake outer membrane protein [Aestuariibaculum suncheonense]MBD0836066.1 RagB/SusD family nutrient uptake outer membrane protein [Aestuariibaculum suncheonense]
MKKTIYKTLILFTAFLINVSCNKDYLDVSDELAGEQTMEEIFSIPSQVRSFHRNIFTGIPESSNMIFSPSYTLGGLDNPWAGLTDELKAAQGTLRSVTTNGYNSGNAPFHRWGTLYTLIRQANLFLDNAKVIPQSGEADFIDIDELSQLKAQARFLRAYYHYLLFELYGPIPIMDFAADPSSPDLDFARNSVDEVVNFIDSELKAVSEQLNDIETADAFLALPTKGVALAVRGRLLMYAASPLFNGEYQEALSLTDKDGKQLFPERDDSKWQRALDAMQEFIDFAEDGYYSLYKEYNTNGTYNPDTSLYNLFRSVNEEVIWASPRSSWGTLSNEGIDRRCTPRTERGGFASIAITQELVDDYLMVDGLPIEESPLYSETGFSTAGEDISGHVGEGIYKMWINREPRFYQTVFFQNRNWHISNNKIQFHRGSGNGNMSSNYPWSGYMLYKRISREIYNSGSYPRNEYRPAILYRLAEFYLLYAEALNEVNPSDTRVIEYVDRIRERAGIPKLIDIKPEIVGNKIAQREAIRREMRVELATEGQRYFDVRRWMIAENPVGEGGQGGPFYGMNMSAEQDDATFYQRTPYENRVWNTAMYLYPIPLNEIQKSEKLVQNPGW